MTVEARLEQRIRQINVNLSVEMASKYYDPKQADERELLEGALKKIRELEACQKL